MKKFLVISLLFIVLFLITGCDAENKIEKNKQQKYISAVLDSDGNIVIDTVNITEDASFINYEVDGVTIQFIVVRATDGTVRVAFNTCQVCNPSPNAYFIQDGKYFICQNCGNRFHIDELGIAKGGCNPTPVDEKIERSDKIIIDKDYVESYKTRFENWNGPTA